MSVTPIGSCWWWACLTGAVASISLAGCGSGGNTVDQSSLPSVAALWADAWHADGTADIAALMSIRDPSCPEASYRRYLEKNNERARRLTQSNLKAYARRLPANLHPVTAVYRPAGAPATQSKTVSLTDVPSSGIAPGVVVRWGLGTTVTPDELSHAVNDSFVLVDGKWYDANCPVVGRAQQARIAQGQ